MGAECSRCGNDIYDECGYCNLRDERDALLAERDALRGRLDDANAAAARALAAADVERDRFDALREAGDAAIRTADDALTAALDDTGQLDWCAARDDYYSCKRAWRAATGEGA